MTTVLRSTAARSIAIAVAIITATASQLYYGYNASAVSYDSYTLLFGVLFPLLVGCALFFATNQKVLLLGYFGLFWSVVDDGPVFFDSVLTWPEVTRFHPYGSHFAIEIVLHLITLAFLLGAVKLSLRHSRLEGKRANLAYSLAISAFIISYAQNIPLDFIQTLVDQSWYQLDVLERAGSVFLFSISLLEARSRPKDSGFSVRA